MLLNDRQRWSVWTAMDRYRRWLGDMLDESGVVCRIETPFRVVLEAPALTLKAYGSAGAGHDVVLLVSAPIKRAYIWDLLPEVSVVRQCLRGGSSVYLIQWERLGDEGEDFGLAQYADRLILDSLRAIAADCGREQAFLVGHSLGGTLAAIFAALHPDQVRGLVLLGAPLHFGPGVGALGPWSAVAPSPSVFTSLLGNVPGSFLDTISVLAAPTTFQWARWMDWLASLPDSQLRQTHLLVERWALDEQPLSRRLFEDVVGLLYREDRFMAGNLAISGRQATPTRVKAPLLSVVDPRCTIVPAQSVLPFHRLAGSSESRVLWYEGDTGVCVQHLGMLVGRRAHDHLWPEIVRWIHGHSQEGAML